MGSAIIETLSLALGAAFSPIPIATIILLLMTRRGGTNGAGYVLGWFLGLLLLMGSLVLFIGGIEIPKDRESSLVGPILKIVFGLLFWGASIRSWKRRLKVEEEPGTPRWMERLDRIGFTRSLVLGALLGTANLKNLPLLISAAAIVARQEFSMGALLVALSGFALISSLGVAAPVLVIWLGRDKAETLLQGWKHWLSVNNAVILSVLFLIIGTALFAKGIAALV